MSRKKISIRTKSVNAFLKYGTKPVIARLSLSPRIMRALHRIFRRLSVFIRTPGHVTVEHKTVAGVRSEMVFGGAVDGRDRIILYLHGGGYFFCSPRTHRGLTWRLSAKASAPVLAPDYRMAPDHSIEESLEDALAVYRSLLDDGYRPENITVGGDSAGGHLALALTLKLRDMKLPLPSALICLSPWSDLSASGHTLISNAKKDPMFPSNGIRKVARFLVGERDPKHPLVSPLFGDLRGFPPMIIFAGSTEVLLDDSRRLHQAALRDGVDSRLEIWESMPHAFPVLSDFVPEGKEAIDEMGQFLARIRKATRGKKKGVKIA